MDLEAKTKKDMKITFPLSPSPDQLPKTSQLY